MKREPTQQQAWLGHMKSGMQFFKQGRPSDAAQAFARAAKLHPERVESWINLASALLEFKRFDEALLAVERALSLQPENMVSHLILGDVQRLRGKWQEAVASYRKAVSIQRAPLSLNKLACALRAENKGEEAEELYREVLGMNPDYTVARVNLATLQVVLGRYKEAETQLNALAELPLPALERSEVDSARLALSEYFRLNQAITSLVVDADSAPLEAALRDTPENALQADKVILGRFSQFAESVSSIPAPPALEGEELPVEWPLIEAMYMIPQVRSVSEYLKVKAELKTGLEVTGALLESTNMEASVHAARAAQDDMQDPVKAELHLRHWHALACRNVPMFVPGHFKYTQNWVVRSPTLQLVDPAMASGTFRHFIKDIYHDVPPGIARATVVYMAVCDLHAFGDGNGRVALTWLNRELEWAGLMPALFGRDLGIKGKLGNAMREVRNNNGDLAPIYPVIIDAQSYAREFCSELAQRNA